MCPQSSPKGGEGISSVAIRPVEDGVIADFFVAEKARDLLDVALC
jgi:actin-like ATPase involved in cell morphogenesis